MSVLVILGEAVGLFKVIFGILIFIVSISVWSGQTATAIFAAGCFWCIQHDFDHVSGVIKTIVGYTGGQLHHPTYAEVSHGGTGHYEAIEVIYDPAKVSYVQLLNVFWHHIDPTDARGQFCDTGDQYRAAIFYRNQKEKQLAEMSKKALMHSGRFKQITTQILPVVTFYPAEEYHQKYYQKNPLRYRFYRYNCGRDQRLKHI